MNATVNDKEQKLETCYHCSNQGLLYIVGEATSNWNDYDEDGIVIYWREKKWTMLQCPVCENVSLHTEYTGFDTPLEIEYVYPRNTFEGIYSKNRLDGYYVPEHIRITFESALKAQHIDSQLCLISMRKTLELICKDQGAKGHSLEQMMESLIKHKKWPMLYRDICWIIRQCGNIAVHAYMKAPILSTDSIDKLIGYLYGIIEYSYIMPNQISALKSHINFQKSNLHKSESKSQGIKNS